MLAWDAIERGFEGFLELLRANPRAWEEFEQSRGAFFVHPAVARAPQAERRHLEWFLLERPSRALGGVPVEALQAEWRASEADPEVASAFLQSLPGAFEVTSAQPADGLWVQDLFSLGEHPILEARATPEIAVGDLLVGRLFPAGGGAFLLSPAVSCFRNRELCQAVRRDLEHMRSARRGVLRIQQLELEHLFFGAEPAARLQDPPPAERWDRVRDELTALGLKPRVVRGLVARLRRASSRGDGSALTEVLNRLAFETDVDLSKARLVLAELWQGAPSGAARPSAEPGEDARRDARAALAAFDRGRAEGKDLEQLFRDLERDLGVGPTDEPSEPAEDELDFPGAVGAMVEEFLWEAEREGGSERAASWGGLRRLADYGRSIGDFEDLGVPHVLDFAGRWLLDEGQLESREEAERVLEAVGAFCRWCEEQHGVPLWSRLDGIWRDLCSSVARLVLYRRATQAPRGSGAFRVLKISEGEVLLRSATQGDLALQVQSSQAPYLCAGDLVRVARVGERHILGAAYPKELAEHLS